MLLRSLVFGAGPKQTTLPSGQSNMSPTATEVYRTEEYDISSFGYKHNTCHWDKFIVALALHMRFHDKKKNMDNHQLYPLHGAATDTNSKC